MSFILKLEFYLEIAEVQFSIISTSRYYPPICHINLNIIRKCYVVPEVVISLLLLAQLVIEIEVCKFNQMGSAVHIDMH